MTELHDVIHAVIDYANKVFDGSRQSCADLEELIWQVRLAHHHEPQVDKDWLDELERRARPLPEIDLEELGL